MRAYGITRPPRAIQHAKLDNLTLVQANLLHFKRHYQQLANDLPKGSVLIILPEPVHKLRRPIDAVATHLKKEGYQVTTISANKLAGV